MRGNRFSIYDSMEKRGYFDDNPANSYSRDKTTGESLYSGPIEFPKMLYHPEGEEKIVVPAEIISTPMGAKAVGEQREMIHETVKNRAEEQALLAEGWHDHPAKAVRKRVELYIVASPEISEKDKAKLLASIPSISSDTRIRELERELARLTGGTSELLPQGQQKESDPTVKANATGNALGARFGAQPAAQSPA